MKNTSEYLKLLLKTVIGTIQEILDTENTELSKYIWKLKDESEIPLITWNIKSVVNHCPEEVFVDYV